MKSGMRLLLGWALSLALLLTGCGSGTGEAPSGSPDSQPEKELLRRKSRKTRGSCQLYVGATKTQGDSECRRAGLPWRR